MDSCRRWPSSSCCPWSEPHSWLLGWPASDLATIYLRQFEHFDGPGNLANPWTWAAYFARAAAPGFYILGYAAAAGVAVAIGVLAARASRPRAMLTLALLSALALPFLLPKMHERYLFLADVLALALALAVRSRTSIAIAAGIQLASLTALASYVFSWPVPALIGAFAGGAALLAIASAAYQMPGNRRNRYSVVAPSHSSCIARASSRLASTSRSTCSGGP